jgi:hypothetical protein
MIRLEELYLDLCISSQVVPTHIIQVTGKPKIRAFKKARANNKKPPAKQLEFHFYLRSTLLYDMARNVWEKKNYYIIQVLV